MSDSHRFFAEPPPEASLPVLEFLAWLERPAVFLLKGRDPSRARVLAGGLHGNEPSGTLAIHRLLQSPPSPLELPTDVWLVLGNVGAALARPPFSHRAQPGGEDMNRVWDQGRGTPLRDAATDILARLRRGPRLEALVDLHNNTGHNPTYAVLLRPDPRRLGLARAWTSLVVHYEGLQLHTLMEAVEHGVPSAVIECGQAGSPEADVVAYEGARRYLQAADPFAPREAETAPPQVFRSVARVFLPSQARVSFSQTVEGAADLTIPPRLDRFNFVEVPVGTLLARCSPRGWLRVEDNLGRDVTEDYLSAERGEIRTLRPMVPVMMTTSADAARSDCLFYVAEPSAPQG